MNSRLLFHCVVVFVLQLLAILWLRGLVLIVLNMKLASCSSKYTRTLVKVISLRGIVSECNRDMGFRVSFL